MLNRNVLFCFHHRQYWVSIQFHIAFSNKPSRGSRPLALLSLKTFAVEFLRKKFFLVISIAHFIAPGMFWEISVSPL